MIPERLSSSQQDILWMGFPAWEGDYQKSTIALVEEMARVHRVIYVEYPFTLTDIWKGIRHQGKKPVKRILGLSPRLRDFSDTQRQLHVLTLPPLLPLNWANPARYDRLMQMQIPYIFSAIHQQLQRLSFRPSICINAFNPFIGNFLQGAFEEQLSIYYCYDEIAASPWAKKHGPRLEEALMRKVDLVITSSDPLRKTKSAWNPNCETVKNGVDFNRFHKAYSLKSSHASAKCLGYLGSIDDRLDYDLLYQLAIALPQYEFLFVGRIVSPELSKQLEALPNVSFTGAQSGEALIAQTARMDLGMIPFVKNRFTQNIYPLKINEYLATGIPVVSTPFTELDEFSKIISIAENWESFKKAVLLAFSTDHQQKQAARIAFAKENTWEARAQLFLTHISQHLASKYQIG